MSDNSVNTKEDKEVRTSEAPVVKDDRKTVENDTKTVVKDDTKTEHEKKPSKMKPSLNEKETAPSSPAAPSSAAAPYPRVAGRSDTSPDRYERSHGKTRYKPFFRRKVCKFCTKKLTIDYKEPEILRRFTTDRGKILPRRITGTCAKHQRKLAIAVKRARILALLPFVAK